jgi:hypothetical protein
LNTATAVNVESQLHSIERASSPRGITTVVGLARGPTHAGGLADEAFVKHPNLWTEELRTHKGFVIKPRRQNGRQQTAQGLQVEVDRGPGVLARRRQAR